MQTYEEAVSFINQIHKYSIHPGIENAARLLEQLDHPEKALKIIHVAGTNGKGSVCAFLADMLTALDKRVGLFISPHLIDMRERIQLNRNHISSADFLSCFNRVQEAVLALSDAGYEGITYFDYFFAIAICYFADKNVDYCVLETGLGGLYDSTNAISSPVLTIITSISMDHTDILGDTLQKIAVQKAGIIKPNVPLIYCADEPSVCEVLTGRAFSVKAPCLGIARRNCNFLSLSKGILSFVFHIDMLLSQTLQVNSTALYQMENGAIAYSAAVYLYLLEHGLLQNRNFLPGCCSQKDSEHAAFEAEKTAPRFYPPQNILPDKIRLTLKAALKHSCWEGRMEQIASEVFIDGAHNADGIRLLLSSVRLLTKTTPSLLLFTAVKEKDTHQMIQEICESGLFRHFILTTLEHNPRAIPAEVLKQEFEKYTSLPVSICENVKTAFALGMSLKQPGELFLSAGSLYLVGAVKEYLTN